MAKTLEAFVQDALGALLMTNLKLQAEIEVARDAARAVQPAPTENSAPPTEP